LLRTVLLLLTSSLGGCAVSDVLALKSSESFIAYDANRNVVARGSSVRYQ
jgi:hypothetical protein